MGKTKIRTKSGSGKDILHSTNTPLVKSSKKSSMRRPIEDLLTEAATLLEQSQPELALPLAEEALRRLEEERDDYSNIDNLLERAMEGHPTFPEALVLNADINLALGDGDAARINFIRATRIDPDGALVSADPYLWLSQLCEEGGKESIMYFEKAAEVLRNEIDLLEEAGGDGDGEDDTQGEGEDVSDQKRAKLAEALCGMAEIYMTDLSWEADCEERCERYVTEAVAVCPDHLSAGVLQTLASVRISQLRIDEARQVLAGSMNIWKDIPPEVEDPARPDFATRVSLVRLLMDVEAESDALVVVEGLVKEDEESIEALYLAGWCQFVLAKKANQASEDQRKHQEQAGVLFRKCLKLYQLQGYEDVKLRDHAVELLRELNQILGISDHEDEWEDAEDDEDDEDSEIEVNGHEAEAEDVDVEMS